MSRSAKAAKRNSNTFCTRKRRLKETSKTKVVFAQDKKDSLAASDKGSWYKQVTQWPDLKVTAGPSTENTSCNSKVKLTDSKKSCKKRIADDNSSENSDFSEESSSSSDSESETDSESEPELSCIFHEPTVNSIVNPGCLQSIVNCSAVCKDCHGSLQVCLCLRRARFHSEIRTLVLALASLAKTKKTICVSKLSEFISPLKHGSIEPCVEAFLVSSSDSRRFLPNMRQIQIHRT